MPRRYQDIEPLVLDFQELRRISPNARSIQIRYKPTRLVPNDPHAIHPKTSQNKALAYICAVQGPGFEFTWADVQCWYKEIFREQETGGDSRRRRYLSELPGWDFTRKGKTYTTTRTGHYIWHPGWRPNQGNARDVSDLILKASKCALPDCKNEKAGDDLKLTKGRILPGSLGGAYVAENCQAECESCNYSSRDKRFPRIHTVPIHGFDGDLDWVNILRQLASAPPPVSAYGIYRGSTIIT